MNLNLKHPCGDCPFRINSLPGWTGNYSPQAVLATVSDESPFFCHTLIDYMDDDWQEKAELDGEQCAGWAAYAANTCKVPRFRPLAEFVRKVGQRQDVFSNPMKFLEHHQNEPARAPGKDEQ